ncbi:MAG: trigger factor [Clostridia bacterium]|nr:trigger factor [Clostridia bacterium]
MKSTFISKEKNDVTFKMEFTAEEFENAIVKVYQKEKDKFEIDGFRKGKAPRSLIEKRYGETIFFDDAINNLFQLNYPLAMDELDLNVIDYPRTELSQTKKGEGFDITVTVTVYPEFEVTGYKGVEVDRVPAEVTDEDVDKEISNMADRNSRMVEVDRPVQDGDTVLIDYAGFVGDDQFEGGTAERYPLQIGSGTFIPGFEEQLIGANKDDDVEVKVTFPEEYHAEDLAGKEAIFKCKVHEIKEKEVPAIDDDFVKDVSEFDTLDELKASKKEELQKAAEARAEEQMKNSCIEKIFEANDIEVPDVMVEEEIDSSLQQFDQQLRVQGMDLATYVQYMGEDMAKFRESIREDAFKKTKTRMLIGKIVDQEEFEVSDEEIHEYLEDMAKQYSMEVDKLVEAIGPQNVATLGGDIKMRKAVDFIYENAVIK